MLMSPRAGKIISNSKLLCNRLSDLGNTGRSLSRWSTGGHLQWSDVQLPCVLNKELNKKHNNSHKV